MAQPVRVVRVEERVTPDGAPTPGMDRRQALAGGGVWLGTVRTQPHMLSGWHHHGEYETYIYVLDGEVRLDCLTEDATDGTFVSVSGLPGDFIHVPRGVVHREGSAGAGIEAVLLRVGEGQVVFDADGPTDVTHGRGAAS